MEVMETLPDVSETPSLIFIYVLLHMNAHYSNIGANPYVRTYIMIVCDLYIGYLYYHKSTHLE